MYEKMILLVVLLNQSEITLFSPTFFFAVRTKDNIGELERCIQPESIGQKYTHSLSLKALDSDY